MALKRIIPAHYAVPFLLLCLFFSTLWGAPPAKANLPNEDMIVFTAHQNWLSRIYLLRMDGSVIRYFEYEFYYFADLEVVNNEVYVAEAFAPRVLKVDLETGDLDVVVDDWSLYYFYDVGFDGTYFYVTEWDLNRYDINGNKDGTASFSYDVHGGASDGTYYWTLTDGGQIKCWDASAWPAVAEIPENAFFPPSPQCRGLWFDGEYFWTAESIDETLGQIYQFDSEGIVVNQWTAPAFLGWSACVVKGVYPQEVVIDNADPAFLSFGFWGSGNHARAVNTGLRYSPGGTGGKIAAWRTDEAIPAAGSYDVYVWKFAHIFSDFMATNAHYQVYHGEGASDWILLDLSGPGDEWIYLGTFAFTNASPQGIVITDEANGYVIADAVKLVYAGGP